jgi:hypothetical protein
MDEIGKIKKEIAALRAWAYLPEKKEIVDILTEAREFLLKGQPNSELTPEGYFYRATDGRVQRVPPDHWYVRSEKRIVSAAEFTRQGNRDGLRVGCYPTRIIIEER